VVELVADPDLDAGDASAVGGVSFDLDVLIDRDG
jgi:hypothetical protein